MLEFEHILQAFGGTLKKQMSRKQDSAVLQVQLADGSDRVLRIYQQEIPAYQTLEGHDCDCLPHIFSAAFQDGLFVVEEEFIDGVSLQEMISGGARMDEKRTVSILGKISEALFHLHEEGFIHRDVKPEHVMLTPEGRVVLLDMDASMRIMLEKPSDTQLIGTAIYAAPEQFGLSRSDRRTDIYAMGILMNELLTGVHPAVTRYRSGPLAEVIDKCIQMNPSDRYQTVTELMEASLAALGDGPNTENDVKSGLWLRKIFSALAVCMLAFAVLLGASAIDLPSGGTDTQDALSQADEADAWDEPEDADQSVSSDAPEAADEHEATDEPEVTDEPEASPEVKDSGKVKAPQEPASPGKPEKSPAKKPELNADVAASAARVEGTEYLQLYIRGRSHPVYYNYRRGSQSASLYTEDGTLVDETFKVYADKAVGVIENWDPQYDGWRLRSENCQINATGYVHAEKDGRHYAVQVLVMGEPMSAYTKIPTMWNLADGYLKPKANVYVPDSDVVEVPYNKEEEVSLYLVAMFGFYDLKPQCSSDLVSIKPYEGSTDWQYPVFVLTFRNPTGGNAEVKVTSNHNNLTFLFMES